MLQYNKITLKVVSEVMVVVVVKVVMIVVLVMIRNINTSDDDEFNIQLMDGGVILMCSLSLWVGSGNNETIAACRRGRRRRRRRHRTSFHSAMRPLRTCGLHARLSVRSSGRGRDLAWPPMGPARVRASV